MADDKPTYSDHEELASNLRTLFMSCQSVMDAALESLVKAKRFKLTLEVSGWGNAGWDLFLLIARQLGVQFEERELPKELEEQPMGWISDHTTKNLRAWIPGMKDRSGDLHVMLPICFEHHVTELRKQEPAFPMPKVDNLYLLLIWSECFGGLQAPLSARVLRDLVAWESAGIISAYQYAGNVGDEIRIANHMAMLLSHNAQMYLGFRAPPDGYYQCERAGLVEHPFNARTLEIIEAMGYVVGDSTVVPPWMIRNYSWEADKVAVILKNAFAHYVHPAFGTTEDKQKTTECLELRLDGLTEDEIAKRLEFNHREEYDRWLKERGLDIDSQAYRHPYEGWLAACDYFGVEPTPELFDSLVGPWSDFEQLLGISMLSEPEAKQAAEPEEDDPIPGFRHSPDFRSVRLPGGRSLTLTERQSEVVGILFDVFVNGTPELSQAYLIEEAYPGVSETRLKRLFGNNDLYDLLIEAGSNKWRRWR